MRGYNVLYCVLRINLEVNGPPLKGPVKSFVSAKGMG
jgi:hypothetical protein